LAVQRESFAFETTLASRSFAPFIRKLKKRSYKFHLIFLWLANVELAKARVASRVAAGGHDIPDEILERRYRRGIENFFGLYQGLADEWHLYDNSRDFSPRLIAHGKGKRVLRVKAAKTWNTIKQNQHAIKKTR
ncbi:MAG: zeta toxin family protein, partial [Pyrinomonadaceae bacterium]